MIRHTFAVLKDLGEYVSDFRANFIVQKTRVSKIIRAVFLFMLIHVGDVRSDGYREPTVEPCGMCSATERNR